MLALLNGFSGLNDTDDMDSERPNVLSDPMLEASRASLAVALETSFGMTGGGSAVATGKGPVAPTPSASSASVSRGFGLYI